MHRFVKQMVLRNTISAALQRSRLYQGEVEPHVRSKFRAAAGEWLENFGKRYNRQEMNEQKWCSEIADLCDSLGVKFCSHITGGGVRIGIAQKMVSLYLKYLWLIGKDETKRPLFAVVDRGVMNKAGLKGNWTQLIGKDEYLTIVRRLDQHAISKGYKDGTAWEAEEWSKFDDED